MSINRVLREISNDLNVLDPDDIIPRLRPFIQLEEGDTGFEVVVLDDKKNKRFDSNGDAVSIKDLVSEFIQKRPHLVKSSLKGGGNGGGDIKNKDPKKNKVEIPASGVVFTKEQLKDPQFVSKNYDAIQKAIKAGNIQL